MENQSITTKDLRKQLALIAQCKDRGYITADTAKYLLYGLIGSFITSKVNSVVEKKMNSIFSRLTR
jgi:hypothetical protein